MKNLQVINNAELINILLDYKINSALCRIFFVRRILK